MELVITGHRVDVTDALRDYAEKKIGKVTRNVDGVIETQIELSVNRNPSVPDNQIVEVTLIAKGTVIRAEESSENMYASLDMVADKLERQIRRYRQKLNGHDRHHRQKVASLAPAEAATAVEAEEEEIQREIVPTRSFPVRVMSPDDAAAQLDLLGHNFIVFVNQFTEQVNVIYHRKDGNYGLIEPTS
jgi:putative sigma-54 modulation protein